ncbi:MAG: DUF2637 domain-containing protein, partial [Acidimicrobiia bacterium]
MTDTGHPGRTPDTGVQRKATAAVVVLFVVAAACSYWHMTRLAADYGMDTLTVWAWPLSADGLVVVAGLCLLADSDA